MSKNNITDLLAKTIVDLDSARHVAFHLSVALGRLAAKADLSGDLKKCQDFARADKELAKCLEFLTGDIPLK